MNFFVALVLTMVVTAFLGVVIEFLAYRPLRNSTRIAALITAIGVSFFLEYIMVYFVGADKRAFPQAIETVKYNLGSIEYHKRAADYPLCLYRFDGSLAVYCQANQNGESHACGVCR